MTDQTVFWQNRRAIAALVLIVLAVTITLPGIGTIAAFIVAVTAAVLARKHGSLEDIGFRAPESWPRLLVTTFVYGLLLQLTFLAFVEPLITRLTGETVDLSTLEGVRGDFTNFLILMAIGWGIGGFLEEVTFRGFVVGRVRWLLDSGAVATWTAVLVAAIPFGLAHAWQGPAGMISTGLTGFLVGAAYVLHRFNLWYAIFTHGFINTFGIVAIYLNLDREIARIVTG